MKQSERLLQEHRARAQFQRKLEQLRFEVSMGTPRRVLDYLVDHLEDLLPQLQPGTTLHKSFAEQLDRAKRMVASRHNLKLVKGHNA